MRVEASPALPQTLRASIRNSEEAFGICDRIEATMEALLQLIEAESELLRSGKQVAAAALQSAKNECARAYMEELDLLRVVGPQLDAFAPGSVERLRRRHEEFVSVLQIDLAALATARAIVDPPARVRSTPARERAYSRRG